MNIYEDYRSWKDEHIDLIDSLLETKNKVISRITHVFAVCEYISAKEENGETIDSDLELIFETGFEYLSRQFETITTLFNKDYRKNLDAFNKASRSINLLLHVDDFIDEYKNLPNANAQGLDKLNHLEDNVLEYAESGKDIPDEYFGLLNDMVYKLFPEDLRTVNDILYDVAVELDLIDLYKPDEEIDNIFGVLEKARKEKDENK